MTGSISRIHICGRPAKAYLGLGLSGAPMDADGSVTRSLLGTQKEHGSKEEILIQ